MSIHYITYTDVTLQNNSVSVYNVLDTASQQMFFKWLNLRNIDNKIYYKMLPNYCLPQQFL